MIIKILSNGIDEKLNKSIKITIIATGFDDADYNDFTNDSTQDNDLKTSQKKDIVTKDESKKIHINNGVNIKSTDTNLRNITNYSNTENKQSMNNSMKLIDISNIDNDKLVVHSLTLENDFSK